MLSGNFSLNIADQPFMFKWVANPSAVTHTQYDLVLTKTGYIVRSAVVGNVLLPLVGVLRQRIYEQSGQTFDLVGINYN